MDSQFLCGGAGAQRCASGDTALQEVEQGVARGRAEDRRGGHAILGSEMGLEGSEFDETWCFRFGFWLMSSRTRRDRLWA